MLSNHFSRMALGCMILFSACLVPSSRYNDLETHKERLEWELERENNRNQALQTYIDMILKGNEKIQHPLIYRKPIATDGYSWSFEKADKVYNPYFLNQNTGKWAPVEIPSGLRVRHQGESYVFEIEISLLFEQGSVNLLPSGKGEINKLAQILKDHPEFMVRVEGHTDEQEVWEHPQWKDSWTLSVMRAVEIIRQLEKAGIPGERLIASGRAELHAAGSPIGPQNRRVEILLSPMDTQP